MGSSVIFSGTKVKTLKSTIDLNGGNDIISSTTDPTSVAVSANIGSLLLNSSSGKLYRKNDSGSSTNWSEVGSGQSGINYISNPSAATNTTGWSTYAESDSVTFQDTGDTVTLNSHGLSNGTAVSFSVITTTTGISTNTLYYVVGATTNTFQLADTVGGAAKALTNNGSGTLLRSIPKLGTGGSANITWTRSTTTPLRGAADFEFNKDAANRMGQGVSTDFTIDNADLAKVLTISFDCEVVSGTYAAGDLDIFIIQDPSGTPVLIQPAGYVIQAGSVGTKVRQIATFQTDSSVKSYRLCIHASTVNASAYVVAADTVTVGPQVVQYGAPVTDWQDFPSVAVGTLITGVTSNPTYGTTAVNKAQWRRVGGNMEIMWDYRQTVAGSAGSGMYLFNLPAGLSIDTNRVTVNTGSSIGGAFNSSASLGVFRGGYSTTGVIDGQVNAYSSTQLKVVMSLQSSSIASEVWGSAGLANFSGYADLSFSLRASVPIAGWSSTVQMSNDTDTRVVAASYSTLSSTTVTSGTALKFTSKLVDTHAAYNTGTGEFTVPVAGVYEVSMSGVYSSSAADVSLMKNGSNLNFGSSAAGFAGIAAIRVNGVCTVECVAGDVLKINPRGSVTTADSNGVCSFRRLSGPSAIAAQDTVAAMYYCSTNQSAGTATPINFDTKVFDSTGSVTTGASWKFSAPVSGTYLVSNYWITATFATNVGIYKNGTIYAYHSYASASNNMNGSLTLRLLAGDYIDIRPSGSMTMVGGSLSAVNITYVCISRVGN